MKDYQAKNIRNLTIVGHGSVGKTTLAEALLFTAGVIDRQGRVEDGQTPRARRCRSGEAWPRCIRREEGFFRAQRLTKGRP